MPILILNILTFPIYAVIDNILFADDFTKDETVASGEDASINADFVVDLSWYPVGKRSENAKIVLWTLNKWIFYLYLDDGPIPSEIKFLFGISNQIPRIITINNIIIGEINFRFLSINKN